MDPPPDVPDSAARKFTRRGEGCRERNPHQVAIVLQKVEHGGKNLHQFGRERPAPLGRRQHQAPPLVVSVIHQRLIQLGFVAKVIVQGWLAHRGRFDNVLH